MQYLSMVAEPKDCIVHAKVERRFYSTTIWQTNLSASLKLYSAKIELQRSEWFYFS